MKRPARCFAAQHVEKNAKDISNENDKDNSDAIECTLEMVGMEFLNVTIATDDHNEDSEFFS